MGRSNNKVLKVGFALLLIVAAFPAYDFLKYNIFARELVVKCDVERVYNRKIKLDGFPRSVLPHCEFSFDMQFCKTRGPAVYRFVTSSGKLKVYEEAATVKNLGLAEVEPNYTKFKDELWRHTWSGKRPISNGSNFSEASSFSYNRLSGLIYHFVETKDYTVTTKGSCSRISPSPDIPLLLNDFFLSVD